LGFAESFCLAVRGDRFADHQFSRRAVSEWRTEGVLHDRHNTVATVGPLLLIALRQQLWVFMGIDRPEIPKCGHRCTLNPLNKTGDTVGPGGCSISVPALDAVGAGFRFRPVWLAWLLGRGQSTMGALPVQQHRHHRLLLTVGFGLFPFLLISSTDPRSSLTCGRHSVIRPCCWHLDYLVFLADRAAIHPLGLQSTVGQRH